MTPPKGPVTRWFNHRTDLPKWLSSGIGQIAIEWSVLERELEELVRLLMDADIQIGRIVTHDTRARTRIAIATNLIEAHVQNKKLPPDLFSEFAKIGSHINERLQSKRDAMVHGVWEKRGGKWWVLRMKAKRPTPPGLQAYLKLSGRHSSA